MVNKIYNVYVGHYNSASECKKDLKKLNSLNFKGYVFCLGDFYSLKVYTCYHEEQAKYAENIFKKHNLDVFIDSKDI